MSFIAAAIIGAVGVGAGALISSNASRRASDAAASAATANNDLQRQIYTQNTENLSPWMTRGNAAGEQINGLLGIGGNPSASRAPFDTYRGSTGYDFGLNEGLRAMDHTAAARGGLQSGAALKAGQRYGQDYASTKFQEYLNNLQGVSGQGLTAGSAVAGVGTGYANAVGANNNAAADATGNAALLGASNINSLIGQTGQSLAYTLGNRPQGFSGSAYGGGSITNWANGLGNRSSIPLGG